MRKLIGISLSFCIAQIISGDVEADEVVKIITVVGSTTDEQWERTEKNYSETYWRDNPEMGVELLRRFRREGKIEQCALNNPAHRPVMISGKYWFENESDIGWKDQRSGVTGPDIGPIELINGESDHYDHGSVQYLRRPKT